MAHRYGEQHQRFDGLANLYAQAKPAVAKFIDPDDNIARVVKEASPATVTIARIYTGQANVGAYDRFPNAYQQGSDYATLVYSRLKDPAHIDLLEAENEPVDNYGDLTRFIQRLNEFTLGFCARAKVLGFRPLGLNFSTGYPECFVHGSDYELWPNAWQGLTDSLRALRDANGALGLHEYDAPDLLRLWSPSKQRGYLVGRCHAIYECLPADLAALPLYLTEFGIDYLVNGVTGGFWHNRGEDAPDWMVGQMRAAWEQVYSSLPQLKGICQFLWGRSDDTWTEYDCARTDASIQTFTTYLKETAPVPLPPLSDIQLAQLVLKYAYADPATAIAVCLAESGGRPDATNTAGNSPPSTDRGLWQINSYWHPEVTDACAFDPNCATQAAKRIANGGADFNAWSAYKAGTYRQYLARAQAALDALVPPTPNPPPTGGPVLQPYVFPSQLTLIGALGEEGKPVDGQPFYRISGAAVLQGVSAEMFVTVIGKSGVPVIGRKVVNLFPDGNGEVLQTDGSGTAHFMFGPSSAFTNPGTGPFTIFVADDSAFKESDSIPKRVVYQARLSDIIKSLGDFQGQHTSIHIQLVEQDTSLPTLPSYSGTLEAAALRWASDVTHLSLNPAAALQGKAKAIGWHALPSEAGSESRILINGVRYAAQAFLEGVILAPESNFGDLHAIPYL